MPTPKSEKPIKGKMFCWVARDPQGDLVGIYKSRPKKTQAKDAAGNAVEYFRAQPNKETLSDLMLALPVSMFERFFNIHLEPGDVATLDLAVQCKLDPTPA